MDPVRSRDRFIKLPNIIQMNSHYSNYKITGSSPIAICF